MLLLLDVVMYVYVVTGKLSFSVMKRWERLLDRYTNSSVGVLRFDSFYCCLANLQ